MSNTDLDCFRTEEVVCPYCKTKQLDSHEFHGKDFQNDGDETEVTCGECEKDFPVMLEIDVSYTSRPV